MTDTTAGEGVPPRVLEAIAHNLCSLHDFDPEFVKGQERFAKAVIAEYERAKPAPDFALGKDGMILAAQPSAGARGEAVGWAIQWRHGTALYSSLADAERDRGDWKKDIIPLYATPAQALREALEANDKLAHTIIEEWENGAYVRRLAREIRDTSLAALSKPNAQGREG